MLDGRVQFTSGEIVFLLAAPAIALCRICGMTSPTFQAIAHIYVGGLFGAWLVPRIKPLWDRELYRAMALGMTAIEIVCFTVSAMWPVK